MTAPDDLSALRDKPFSDAVAKFEELLVQEGRAFLIGAGCSKCAGLPLTAELTAQVLASGAIDAKSKEILTAIKTAFTGASIANIEDYLSELIDLLAIAERRAERAATQKTVALGGKEYTDAELRSAADQIKLAIRGVIEKKVSIDTHRTFVAALHRPVRVGKAVPSQIVDYLVLNYDTAIEDALALERVSYADGIDGGVTGWWNPATFDRDGLAARVLKLHGSIDWCEFPNDPLPRRIGASLEVRGATDRRILIWPATTKYRETQLDPYAQLSDRARRIMRPIRGSQRVLVICGYSFGDSHINIEIDRALRESAGDLTVVAFTHADAPTGILKKWYEDSAVREQVLIFANKGFFHGDVAEESTRELLWWKFENVTRLLRGER
ncbi:MAG: SIR2 family protein [Rubrivivax sp.]|nr:SIR2 family protein [Rubrivivax sp.]